MDHPTHIQGQDWLEASYVRKVVDALNIEEGAVRFVGGCVRNALLDVAVSDIDMATVHEPRKVIALLEAADLKAVPTGVDHGTITAVADGHPVEVTTLRSDVETHGRHATVAFTTDWEEDANRRDFTMNAIYADPDGTLYDPVGGIVDAVGQRVRFIGNPHDRIREDYLRILRFFRFNAQYGAGPCDEVGLAACIDERAGLDRLSGERIQAELFKLLVAKGAMPILRHMERGDILSHIIGEVSAFDVLTRLTMIEHTMALVPDAVRRLAALIVLNDKTVAAISERLRLSNAMTNRLRSLASPYEPFHPDADESIWKRQLYPMDPQVGIDRVVFTWAHHKGDAEAWKRLLTLAEVWERPNFPITGQDVMEAGVPSGPKVGEVLQALEEYWMAEDFTPDRAALLAQLKLVLG